MRRIHAAGVALLLHLFAATAPLVARSDATAQAIAFDANPDGAVVVPVLVDGSGPFRFLLDTGSSHSTIADTLASRLGFRAVAKAEVASAAGRVMRPVVRLDRISLGPAERDGILASVLPSAQLQALGARVEGVLGQDFLSGLDYTLDYRGGRLSWDAGPVIGTPGTRLALTPAGGRFLVELPQGRDHQAVRFVPDSGAASLVVFARSGRQRLTLQPLEGQARMSGLAGQRLVDRAVVPVLHVGDATLHNEPAVIVDWRTHVDTVASEGDGLLPLHRFARVSFSARERCMVVQGW